MANKNIIKLEVAKKMLYAMCEEKKEECNSTVIILMGGELIVDVQECGTCKPKRIILTSIGSHIFVPQKSAYKIRNNQMIRANWLEVYHED